MKKHIKMPAYVRMLVILLLLLSSRAEGATVIDSSIARSFNQSSLRQLRQQKEFNYEQTTADPDTNGFWKLLGRFLGKLFRTGTQGSMPLFWKYFFYVFSAAFIIFLLLKLLKADRSWFLFSGKKSREQDMPVSPEENIHILDFNKLIQESIMRKDFRKAIRLFYLLSLKQLTDKGLIRWRPDKTNYEYLKELQPADLKNLFQDNTFIYEHIWYGDFKLNDDAFEKARSSFENFLETIKTLK